MKIKKFKNLWTMGLILFGAILIALYIAKIFFPEFIVGIAEIESVVKFGNYVDTHQWAYYLFTFMVSMFVYYFYCCACCRKKRLSFFDFCIIVLVNVLLYIVQKYMFSWYVYMNSISLILIPCIICLKDKNLSIKYFYSTCFVYIIHTIAQLISLEIRGLTHLINNPNIATLTILVIDTYIWLVLLYNYFNYKERKNYGN